MALFTLLAFCGSAADLSAQDDDISEKARRFVGENGRNYLKPAVSVFSANLNSGLYHTADVHKILGFEIGLVGMLAPIPAGKKTFIALAPDTIRTDSRLYIAGRDYDKNITTPTALGPGNGAKVYYKQGAPGDPPIFEFPGGGDLKYVPLLSPQLSVGAPLGTELILRWVPEIRLGKEVGKLRFLGLGLRHSISQWLPGASPMEMPTGGAFPLDLSANFMFQEFVLVDSAGGDFFKTKAYSLGFQASKKLSILTLYTGVAYENASTDISYTYRPSSGYSPGLPQAAVDVRFPDMKGDNDFRATLGISLKLVFLDLFADYSFASQPVASAGVFLSIR